MAGYYDVLCVKVCGGTTNLACIYDYVATGSRDFAQNSGKTESTSGEENTASSKYHYQ
jgi:hypothetical protein